MVNRSAELTELKRTLSATLNRELWEYSMINEGYLIDWDDKTQCKYAIAYKYSEDIFFADTHSDYTMGTVYFYSKSIATRAIFDVVLPFIKKHPEITW